jgi:hypothetical protein
MALAKITPSIQMIQKAQRYMDKVYNPLVKLAGVQQEVTNSYFFGLLKENVIICPNREAIETSFNLYGFYGLHYWSWHDQPIGNVYKKSSMKFLATISQLTFGPIPEMKLTHDEFKSYVVFYNLDIETIIARVVKLVDACND